MSLRECVYTYACVYVYTYARGKGLRYLKAGATDPSAFVTQVLR